MVKCPKCNERIPCLKIIFQYQKLITCKRCESRLRLGEQPIYISIILWAIFEVILYISGRIDEIYLQIVLFILIYLSWISISSKFIKLEAVGNPKLYKYQMDRKNLTGFIIMLFVLILLMAVVVYMALFVIESSFSINVGIGASIVLVLLILLMIYWIFKREKLKKLIEKEKEEDWKRRL